MGTVDEQAPPLPQAYRVNTTPGTHAAKSGHSLGRDHREDREAHTQARLPIDSHRFDEISFLADCRLFKLAGLQAASQHFGGDWSWER